MDCRGHVVMRLHMPVRERGTQINKQIINGKPTFLQCEGEEKGAMDAVREEGNGTMKKG